MPHHARLKNIAQHHMHHEEQRADQHAFVEAVKQKRLNHRRHGGKHRANIGHVVQQKGQHAPHQRELHVHQHQPQPDNHPGPDAQERFQRQIFGDALQGPV